MNGIPWFKHSPPNGPSVDLISPILIKRWFHFSTSSQAPLLGSRSAAWLVSQHMQIWIKGSRTARQRRVCWCPSQCEARGPGHHRWEKGIGGPSRPSGYYPPQPHLEYRTHTNAHTHMHTHMHAALNHFTCPLHSTRCNVKDVFGLYENKIPEPLQIPCHWLSLLPRKTCKRRYVSLIRHMGKLKCEM